MSQLIPLYIAGPFAPGVKSRGEAQVCRCLFEKHSNRVYAHIVMSTVRLKIKACNPRQRADALQTSTQISVC